MLLFNKYCPENWKIIRNGKDNIIEPTKYLKSKLKDENNIYILQDCCLCNNKDILIIPNHIPMINNVKDMVKIDKDKLFKWFNIWMGSTKILTGITNVTIVKIINNNKKILVRYSAWLLYVFHDEIAIFLILDCISEFIIFTFFII